MKKCFICNCEKPLDDFYAHKKMKDGHKNKCKDCFNSQARAKRLELRKDINWVKKERARDVERKKRLGSDLNYRSKYPEKHKAKTLSKRLCPKIKGNHLHHWNYNIEFAKDIIELSTKDHYKIHRFMTYDNSLFIYKTMDGVPLDSKEKHLNYIEIIKAIQL